MTKPHLLEQFAELSPRLPEILKNLEITLHRLLETSGLKFHSLNGRVKLAASLEQKIARPDRNYEDLSQITDLVAFRIVTYSEDLIEDVARLIERSFDVDYRHSTNKLVNPDFQKFGYRSLHYVCAVPDQAPLRFEIQIRTILQHAWAEIEHDIGYKAAEGLPGAFRRRFSQIASLLEVADREFVSVRNDIRHYEESLRHQKFEQDPVELDELSLRSILERAEVREVDFLVARHLEKPVGNSAFYPDYLLRALRAANLTTPRAILDEAARDRVALSSFIAPYFEFAKRHWGFDLNSIERVGKGYGLLFIAHLAALKNESLVIDKINCMTQFFRAIDYPDDVEQAKAAARELVGQLNSSGVLE